MTYQLKSVYSKYFQKSRSFLYPILGFKKVAQYIPLQVNLAWEGMFSLDDKMLLVSYKKFKDLQWEKYLVETLMANQMFNDFHETEDPNVIVVSFDLKIISEDYDKVLQGKYSEIGKLLKKKIRDFYTYNSPEWAYMESFLFPHDYYGMYGKLLNVEQEHILHTGQLCDLPDLDKETLKIKPYAKINDVDQINMESREDLQIDSNQP